MKSILTLISSFAFTLSAFAQIDTITNAGFERWGNTVPSGDSHTEPTNWYSDQSGGGLADLGPQTCFKSTTAHSGSYSVQVITESSIIAGAVNGVVTTGVVNAPTTSKSDGYIGTVKWVSSGTSTDIRRMRFTGRPDSLIGWYQYTPGAATERAKIRAILHIGNYFDPETPTTYHPDPSDSQVASALFVSDTPGTTVSTWTRFSVPFVYTTGRYASDSTPDYIFINVTPSNNQLTTVTGSTLLLDNIGVVYNPVTCNTVTGLTAGSITSTSATISWTAATGTIVGYVYAVDNSATPPASGAFTTATNVPASGLTPATTYYAHVYDSCASGNSSGWVTVPFTTLAAVNGVINIATGGFTITTFPNPVKDELTVNIIGANGNTGQVQLINISGKLIGTTVCNDSTFNLDMTGLASGIYIIRYVDSEHTQTIKINKQ